MSNSGRPIDDLFVASFNADLEALNSPARIALPHNTVHSDVIEMLDDEGQFLCFMPIAATPDMIAAAHRLYRQGLNHGVRAGEAAAWAKLRFLIGAAPADRG